MRTLLTNLKRGPMTGKASSQRTNFPFNSFAEFEGMFLAASEDGLFSLGGDDDAGVPITGYLKTRSDTCGTDADKRVRFVFLSVETEGPLHVTVGYSKTVSKTYLVTPAAANQDGDDNVIRVPVHRTEKGPVIYVKVQNVGGKRFSIKQIKITPKIQSSGRGKRSATTAVVT